MSRWHSWRTATDGDLSRSLLWRELLSGYGVSDVASVVFRDRHGCWAFLELWRTGGRRSRPDDAALLASCRTPASRGAPARAGADVRRDPGTAAGPGPDRWSSLLSPDLDVLRQTPGTRGPAPAPRAARRRRAARAGRRLQRRGAAPGRGGGRGHASGRPARVHLADGLWLTLRAARSWRPRHRRHDRGVHARRTDVALRPCACGLSRARARTARPPGRRQRHPGGRRADVPVRRTPCRTTSSRCSRRRGRTAGGRSCPALSAADPFSARRAGPAPARRRRRPPARGRAAAACRASARRGSSRSPR